MAAWRHYSYWDPRKYQFYRRYVATNGPRFRGRADLDCADITMVLMIEFAAANGLPVTLWDNDRVRYISKATRQVPKSGKILGTRTWSSKDDYIKAVTHRIGAKSLVNENSVPNPAGPESGDLMAKVDHAALVFQVYHRGQDHPRATDKSIPIFPGNDKAMLELNQTEYFRDAESQPDTHVDYLNHRGFGKEKAELMYFAGATEMRQQGFRFLMYAPGVLDNWKDWDGEGDPPR